MFFGATIGVSGRRTTQWQENETNVAEYSADTLASSAALGERRKFSHEQDDVVVGGVAEIHWPLSMRWQLDGTSTLTMPSKRIPDEIQIASAASAAYFITDRFSIDGEVRHERASRTGEGIDRGFWEVSYATGVAYHLEDRMTLGLRVGELQSASRWSSSERDYHRTGTLSFRISYNLLRGMNAPGLVDQVRPLH
jgi:hypothetical protein